MIELQKSLDAKEFFFFILVFLIATNIAILLNIPFLRQMLGFLFLTLLPGLLLLQILKLNKLGFTEKFVLAVGLSISFLMFFGLLINNSLLSLGYETPLATIPLLISLNIAAIILTLIAYQMNINVVFSLPDLNLTPSEKAFLVVPVLFPALSILGMHVMNTTNINIILMSLLVLIAAYVIFVCFFNQKFPKRLYPVVIYLISISLLLMISLRSNHLIGMDTHVEYRFFQTTLNNLHWGTIGYSSLDACLAVTLLPTIFQSILNVSSEFLFKIFHSLIFSISPLVIYVLSKRYIGEFYGFLTSFFFMSQHNFFWTTAHARTNTAILFFALAMMILFSDKIDPLKKRILFIVFMVSCMMSHYATTYIFFFVMLVSVLAIEALSVKYTFKKAVSVTLVILFFGMIFFWYSQVTKTPFNRGVQFVGDTFSNLNVFFVEESRSATAQSMLGVGIEQKGIPHKIEFVLTWLTFAFIGIGVSTLIRRYKGMSFPEQNYKKADFMKEKFEIEYFVIALAIMGLLVATVALPYITVGYSLERQYLFAMVVLSVFFVIGGVVITKYLNKFIAVLQGKASTKKQKEKRTQVVVPAYLVILLVLIPYFFCATGVTYQVLGVPRSIVLNSEGKQYDMYYINDQQLIANGWLSSSDVVEGRLVNKQKTIGNMTEYLGMFDERNRTYDNGGSEVWE
jgi:uncharacterized membrane protein